MQILGMTAAGLGAAIKNKEVTVMEAVEAVLSRIEEKEKEYHCYVTVDQEGALLQAREVQGRIDRGDRKSVV